MIDPYEVIQEAMVKAGWPKGKIKYEMARLRACPSHSENSIVSVADKCLNEIGPAIGRAYREVRKK